MQNLACICIGDAARTMADRRCFQCGDVTLWGMERMEKRMVRENIKKQKTKGWEAGEEVRQIPIYRRMDTNNAFTLMPTIWTGRKIKTFA